MSGNVDRNALLPCKTPYSPRRIVDSPRDKPRLQPVATVSGSDATTASSILNGVNILDRTNSSCDGAFSKFVLVVVLVILSLAAASARVNKNPTRNRNMNNDLGLAIRKFSVNFHIAFLLYNR